MAIKLNKIYHTNVKKQKMRNPSKMYKAYIDDADNCINNGRRKYEEAYQMAATFFAK